MITILMGASSSGKNYIEERLVDNYGYERIISVTTRPMRVNEYNGREYWFVDNETFLGMINNSDLIEYRTYNTLVNGVHDTWYYGLPKRNFDDDKNYVVILDVNGCREFVDYVGEDNVKVFYIYCEDMIRTERAKARGSFNSTEWNRRLLDDKRVFSKDNMVGINYKKVINQHRDINSVIKEIVG